MSAQNQIPPSKLHWRCRRGMRELDVLLTGWLEVRWPDAGNQLRVQFERLVACEDDWIWDWLSGRVEPDAELAAIVEDIRRQAPGRGRG